MKSNIKQSQAINMIKQIKASVNNKYTQISKNNKAPATSNSKSTVSTFESLFNSKNKRNDVPLIIQNPFSPQKKQNQTVQKKAKQVKNVVFNLCNEKSQPVVTKIQPKITKEVKSTEKNVKNKKESLNIFAKEIIKSVVINQQKKKQQSIISDILKISDNSENQITLSQPSTQFESTQFDSTQSCDNQQINKIESESPNQNNLKKRDGILTLKLEIRNCPEQNIKLNQLQNQLKDADQKVELKLFTYFENFAGLLSFCTKFLRFGHQINYLNWSVKGYFQDDGQSNIIGELVSRFINLSRFEFRIPILSYSDSGALSFSNGLKHLTQLRVLKINVYDRVGVDPFGDCQRKSVQQIANTISNLPNLELLYSINKQIIKCTPPKKLSNYTYSINLTNKSAESKQSRDFTKQENYITKLIIKSDGSSYNPTKKSITQLKSFFNLNHLTFVSFMKNKLSQDEFKFANLLRQMSFQNMRNLLTLTSFQKTMTEFLPINPVMVMTDLWMD